MGQFPGYVETEYEGLGERSQFDALVSRIEMPGGATVTVRTEPHLGGSVSGAVATHYESVAALIRLAWKP